MDVIKYGLIEDWCDFNDMKTLIPIFLPVKKYMNSTKMGYGIERCLYELNEKAPCLSKLLSDHMVTDIKSLLPALNEITKKQDGSSWPVDRHIAAFVATKIPKKVNEQIEAINSTDPAIATAGMVSLLAAIQWNNGPDTLYGLCSWVGGLVAPVVSSYNSKTRRKIIEKNVSKVVRGGKLYDLYTLIDNAEERSADMIAFDNAKADFLAAKQEISSIEESKKNRNKEAKVFGHQVAAVVSVCIAILSMVLLFIFRLI